MDGKTVADATRTADTLAAPARGTRSIKRLESSREATALNRDYLDRMWGDIAAGEKFVFGYGPMELFNAMGLYLVLPVQYGSILAAKQLYGKYQGVLEAEGYFPSLANYESLALGYCFNPDPENAPYGGLPKPAAIVGGYMSEPAIYELFARELDAPRFLMDDPYRQETVPPRWWEEGPEWRDAALIDLGAGELRRCIGFLEETTGKSFDPQTLREYLERADEMSRLYGEIVELAYRTPAPAPFTATDAYSEVAIFETHFGHEWALEHVERMHAEVAARVRDGAAAVPGERVRLLWAGTPLWFNLGFYNAFEESHGAIFVETMYLPRAPRMIQRDREDPVRAAFLRRHMKYTGPSPKASAELIIAQCREFRIDGVVLPSRGATREAAAGSRFMAEKLRRAGISVLLLDYSPLNSLDWDEAAMHSTVSTFIEGIDTGAKRV